MNEDLNALPELNDATADLTEVIEKLDEATSTGNGKSSDKGVLSFVGVPIGHHEDITLRALRALQTADVVVCEEAKTGAQLLRSHNLSKKLIELNEHNEREAGGEVLELVRSGKRVAVISDAGMPVLADPGAHLAALARANGIKPRIVPGISSVTTALIASGFSCDEFDYIGFLSRKTDERMAQAVALRERTRTTIIMETPYRLKSLLEALATAMPDRYAALAMNLTMPSENVLHGSLSELNELFREKKFRGEFVLILDRYDGTTSAREIQAGDEEEAPVTKERPRRSHDSEEDGDDQSKWLDRHGRPLDRRQNKGGKPIKRKPKIDNQTSGFGYPVRKNEHRSFSQNRKDERGDNKFSSQRGSGGSNRFGAGKKNERDRFSSSPRSDNRFGAGRRNERDRFSSSSRNNDNRTTTPRNNDNRTTTPRNNDNRTASPRNKDRFTGNEGGFKREDRRNKFGNDRGGKGFDRKKPRRP